MILVLVIVVTWVALLAVVLGMFHVGTSAPTPQLPPWTPLRSISDELMAASDVTPPDQRRRPPASRPVQAA